MEDITQREYWAEIEAIATGLVEEHKGDQEAIQDALHETIDGHRWLIYTQRSIAVLLHSSHDDAYFEDFGALQADSFAQAVAMMAYAAMSADVNDKLADAVEAYKAEHETEDDEAEVTP